MVNWKCEKRDKRCFFGFCFFSKWEIGTPRASGTSTTITTATRVKIKKKVSRAHLLVEQLWVQYIFEESDEQHKHTQQQQQQKWNKKSKRKRIKRDGRTAKQTTRKLSCFSNVHCVAQSWESICRFSFCFLPACPPVFLLLIAHFFSSSQ